MVIETGKTNALKFVEVVNKASRDGRVITIYAQDKYKPWPWMRNPAWQNFVLDQLEHRAKVRNAEFHPADNVDGLCFSAISEAGDSRVERLSIDHVLDGRIPPTGRWKRFLWMFTSLSALFR